MTTSKDKKLLEKNSNDIKSAFTDAAYYALEIKLLALPPTGMHYVANNLHLLNNAYTPEILIKPASLSDERRNFVKKYQAQFLIESDYGRRGVKNSEYTNWLVSCCDRPERFATLLKKFPEHKTLTNPFRHLRFTGLSKAFGKEGPIPRPTWSTFLKIKF